jgi:ligand-binding sensor domain-containing protein
MAEVKKIIQIILLFFIFYFGCLSGNAQVPYYRRISLNIGNSNLNFTKILQDADGFLWFGSSDGLYKFNGMDALRFEIDTNENSNSVSALYQDSQGVMWVGYKSGMIAFFSDNRLKLFQPEEGIPRKAINAIAADKGGKLWIATGGEGVYFFSDKRLYNINMDDGLNDNYVNTLEPDQQGNMWVGTDEGLALCSSDKNNKVKLTLHKKDGLPDNIVKSIKADEDGNLWIGMQEKGICNYLINDHHFIVPSNLQNWNYGQVNIICKNENEMWIGTDEDGLIYFDEKKSEPLKQSDKYYSLQFSKITDAIADKEGNLWMIGNSNIYQSSGNRLMLMDTTGKIKLKSVHTILNDHHGNLWFTPDQGLVRFSPEGTPEKKIVNFTITPTKDLIDIVSLYEDAFHYIWIGTMGAGLFRLNSTTGYIQKIEGNDLLKNASIMAIAGKGSALWVATLGGGMKITLSGNYNKDQITPVFEILNNNDQLGHFYLYDVFVDSKNHTWFGTDGKGITCIDNGKYSNYTIQNGIKSNVIFSITEDEYGNIWFCTPDEGIYQYDGSSFKNFGIREGLRYLSVSCIIADRNGNIVIVHKHGLDVMDIKKQTFSYFGAEDGIEDINSDLHAITKDQDGHVWIGTDDGIIRFYSSGKKLADKPATIITKISLFNQPIDINISHEFSYNQNDFAFDYIGLWFSNPERVKYEYILDGYNKDWIFTEDRKAFFPNLSPGSYHFKIRSALHPNFRQYSEASFSFTIHPPVWHQAWFIIVASLIAIAVIIISIRFRIKQIRRMESLKKEKIEFQFETLKSQVNPHFLFNSFNTLISTIEENQKQAVDYVEALASFFRNIVT